MKNYVVLFRENHTMPPIDEPLGFQCWADNVDHAEEQCLNAYPDSIVVWVWEGDFGVGMDGALQDYYAGWLY